jgi:hypothetical protein
MTAATQVRTCRDCDRPAKREGRCGAHARAHEITEDIDWFRSFHWSDERIASRLGVSPAAIERRRYAR